MYYQATIITPAQTLEIDPLITTLQLARGQILKIIAAFPPGPAGLLHIQIRDKGWQIAPWSLAESLAWDNYVFEMATTYSMLVEPYELTVISWNDDDSYEHQAIVWVELAEGDPAGGGAVLQYPLQEG